MPMSPQGAPPAYALDKEGTLKPHWWDVKQWGWKKWAALAAGIIVIIVIGVVAGIESAKLNAYPDYSKLTYTLEDTCSYLSKSSIYAATSNRNPDSGTDFFDNFDYYTGYDPSSGFVHYVDAISANTTYNLTYATSTSAVLKVDTSVSNTSNPNASTGRFSVRVTSKKSYDTGLFIFDVIHTPIGCATWPALWLSDVDNWPTNGEIDVMEAVNVVADSENQMTLHTTDGCEMKSKRKERGAVLSTNCLNSTNDNAGCGVTAPAQTFGTTYNNNGGGIVAMELRSAGIRMWQFTRSNVPADIAAGSPDPSTWSEATADFPSTHCDIDTHFKNQSIIMNIDLCGSWAGTASIYNENCKYSPFLFRLCSEMK